MRWFRLHAEFATDPVVQSLSFDDQRHFIMLLCFKCDGLLDREFSSDQARTEVIRKSLGLDGKAWDEMRNRLGDLGLIDASLQPVNWDKRQYVSDQSTERVRKFREKRRGNVTETPPDTETDTETESKKRKSAPRSPAKRLPEDFSLTPERRAVAEAEEVPAERTFETFRDYWLAASGQKARKHDWDAAWRNWCRKQADWSQKPSGGKTKYEQMMEAMDG